MDREKLIAKTFFTIKGCVEEEISEQAHNVEKGLRTLSEYQLTDLLDTLYKLEDEWSRSDDGEILQTLNNLI
jgi:hypothetical protein